MTPTDVVFDIRFVAGMFRDTSMPDLAKRLYRWADALDVSLADTEGGAFTKKENEHLREAVIRLLDCPLFAEDFSDPEPGEQVLLIDDEERAEILAAENFARAAINPNTHDPA